MAIYNCKELSLSLTLARSLVRSLPFFSRHLSSSRELTASYLLFLTAISSSQSSSKQNCASTSNSLFPPPLFFFYRHILRRIYTLFSQLLHEPLKAQIHIHTLSLRKCPCHTTDLLKFSNMSGETKQFSKQASCNEKKSVSHYRFVSIQ